MASSTMAQQLDMGARGFTGDPAVVILRRRDFAVERHRGFHGHQRKSGSHEMD